VKENVRFGMEIAGVPKQEQKKRTEKYISLVGLSEFTQHYPSELSGGMKQRVGIARALAIEPDILLMDEPFGALDAMTRENMQNELLEIWHKERRTVVFVTHDIDEAIFLSDKVHILQPRPGQLYKTMEIDLPRPRNPEIKQDDKFEKLRHKAWDSLENISTQAKKGGS
jgi:ABC-type nitrate/sulfonate/bicarbonate transport system ATPase subunit